MPNQPITAIALELEAKAIVRFAELREFRLRVVDARRMQRVDQRCRQQALAVELALAEMQPHPVREVCDRGIDRSGSDSPDREPNGRQPRVLVHI